jgi:hypothetical protein
VIGKAKNPSTGRNVALSSPKTSPAINAVPISSISKPILRRDKIKRLSAVTRTVTIKPTIPLLLPKITTCDKTG